MSNAMVVYFERTFFVPEGIICWPYAKTYESLVSYISHRKTVFDEVVFGIDSIAFIKSGKSQKEISTLLVQELKSFDPNSKDIYKSKQIDIPIWYDLASPDLIALSTTLQLEKSIIIQKHLESDFSVAMIGFLPGFIYLKGLDESLITERKKIPASRIAPGSVGIADTYTGIYPLQSPGGWHIIGHCPIKLFDVKLAPAISLKIGDRIRFKSIDKIEYKKMNSHG